MTFEREPRHYKIEQHLNKLSIEGGQYFETLIEMIDHYHFRQDGLLCKLRHVVEAPDFARSRSGGVYSSPRCWPRIKRICRLVGFLYRQRPAVTSSVSPTPGKILPANCAVAQFPANGRVTLLNKPSAFFGAYDGSGKESRGGF
ncbi:unnamed protein product [Schistocephalus solidus]|uniref:SH2 domain-containing protein n=1 Tax=Schistocephalus solidus TaxID=70667 RepID=A0A3P7D5Y2_SCHSO|nr:unnamed protein product [Schistocephalus solidus]